MTVARDPSVDLPAPIDSGPSPLLPQHLVDLFFRPRRFFTSQIALGKTPYAVFVAWCYGAAQAIGRLDQNLMRAELGQPRPGWDQAAPFFVESWLGFWILVLGAGALSGVFLWWVGGWWFALRLRWSGAADPDRRLARLVMAYSAFIFSGPTVAAAVIYTLVYRSYAAAYASDELYSLVLMIFPFWSVVVSYRGVRSLFEVGAWRSRIWFLILPLAVYVIAFGALAAVFAFFDPAQAG